VGLASAYGELGTFVDRRPYDGVFFVAFSGGQTCCGTSVRSVPWPKNAEMQRCMAVQSVQIHNLNRKKLHFVEHLRGRVLASLETASLGCKEKGSVRLAGDEGRRVKCWAEANDNAGVVRRVRVVARC